jgi:DNA polymerase-3 subunit epsilon
LNIDQREFAPLINAFPKGIVAIDLETTGLSPLVDRIIELAAIKVTPEKVETFCELINPKVEIPAFTTDIHGITQEMVANKPLLENVLPAYHQFVGDLPIVAHNAKFDLGFLLFAQHQLGHQLGNNDIYCSVKASRRAFKEMPNHKLGTLAEKLNLGLENHHRALDDTLACLKLFNKTIEKGPLNAVLKDARLFNLQDFKKNKMEQLDGPLSVLKKKVESQVVVDIKYKGGSFKGQYRPIKPISLLPMPEGHVLYGLCLFTNIHKSFALSKIQDVKELNAEEIGQRYKALEKSLKNS